MNEMVEQISAEVENGVKSVGTIVSHMKEMNETVKETSGVVTELADELQAGLAKFKV